MQNSLSSDRVYYTVIVALWKIRHKGRKKRKKKNM